MLPEMATRTVRWITNCLMIYCVICASGVKAQESSRALLLYSSDSPPAASPSNNLISIQLDSITLSKIIANSEAIGKVVKKINFRDVNGFPNLVKGESSKFSFFEDGGRSICDVSCDVRCKQIPTPTVAPPNPFVAKKESVKGPPYLPPISKNDEVVVPRKTTVQPTSRTTTESVNKYLPSSTSTTQRPYVQSTTTTFRPRIQSSTTTQRRIPSTTTAQRQLQSTTTTQRPRIQSTTSRFVTTTRTTTQRPASRKSTPGPAYLPVSKKSTPPRPTQTERSYPPATWASSTRIYTQTFPSWSAPIRQSTTPHITTSTAKYLYMAPSNSLIYAGEAE